MTPDEAKLLGEIFDRLSFEYSITTAYCGQIIQGKSRMLDEAGFRLAVMEWQQLGKSGDAK